MSFTRDLVVHAMGIDGTWRRTCTMLDISETGAKLLVEGSIDVMHAREFFLLLSSTGLAFRHCELVRVNGDEVGVRFLQDKLSKKAKRLIGTGP